jgi:uncharacterized repeat protein (TIGR01451 family)
MLTNLRILGVAVALSFLMLGNPASLAAVDFAAATGYPVGTSPSGVATGDFNGDGKPDIAVANTGSSTVSILLGNGDGTFQPAINFNAGNNPTTVAVGDFNGDGKLDLAVFQQGTNSLSGNVSILLGNGDGTFQAPKTLALTSTASVMAVADFNLDSKSDLAVSDFDPSTNAKSFKIFIGNGDGTFQPPKETALAGDSGWDFAVADFNGDSKPDVAIIGMSGVQIFLGNGDGTFSQGAVLRLPGGFETDFNSVIIIPTDFNHDGKIDLLVGSNYISPCGRPLFCSYHVTDIRDFLGNGDGSFQAGRPIVTASVETIGCLNLSCGSKVDRPIVGDFNGDGNLDLVFRVTSVARSGHLASSLGLRIGKGDGTFSATASTDLQNVTPFANSIAIAQDFNADKLADVIAVGSSDNIDVLLNTSPTSGADLAAFPLVATPPFYPFESIGVGVSFTYVASVENEGPQYATGVALTDTLPNMVNFVSATASQGSCVQSNGTVSCNIGSVASALGFEVSIVVTPTIAGTITNSFNVTANEVDPVPANNSATLTTTVAPTSKLTVTRTGTGSGTVTVLSDLYGVSECPNGCTATYVTGTVFTASETPNGNSFFNGWSGACNGSGACTVTMDANKSLTANFVLGENLSVAFAGTGSGSITSKDGAINCANSAGNCSASYLPGTSVSLTAAPAGTSVFAGWSGACSGTDPNVCSVTMNSVQSVTATFNPPPDFALAPATTTFTTQTGAQVTDVLTLTGQNGFAGAVTLTCAVTGPAPLPTCKVSQSPVMLGSSPGSSTLTITAPATLAAFALPRNDGNNTAFALDFSLSAILLGGMGLWLGDFKKRHRLSVVLGGVVLVLFAVLAGCAAGSSTSPPTPQNYTVTVTATSGSLQHSTTVTLTVQ